MTKPRKAPKPASRTLEEKVRLYNRRRADGKRAYARSNVLMEEICKEMKVGQVVNGYRLKDNFLEKVKVFRSHGISRFELEQVVSA